ncbi:hypothetical protein SeLEV6574_g08301 [Synchytrium endobioticum]|uniref:Tf2-1-like SH3-like domain-containing protein n=1 Tax=Synchytrium endobioticum TaxID=286115 RepID=A0A507C8F1_9FUNG|nr:hypothetical protein SeLEV6574_g08301 [Synchytrium endobioticum]
MDQSNWASLLPQAAFSYNNSNKQSISMSPFTATTGQDANSGYMVAESTIPAKFEVPRATDIKARMESVQLRLQACLELAQEYYKKYADEHRRGADEFNIGDEVLLSGKNIKSLMPTPKLDGKYYGPYYIEKKISDVAYQLQLPHCHK